MASIDLIFIKEFSWLFTFIFHLSFETACLVKNIFLIDITSHYKLFESSFFMSILQFLVKNNIYSFLVKFIYRYCTSFVFLKVGSFLLL